MVRNQAVADSLPAIDEFADDDLKERTIDVWADTLAESPYDSVGDVPWIVDERVSGERLIDHIRDVTLTAIEMVDTLTAVRDVDIDRDAVIAGGLLHDISVLYEIEDGEPTELKRRLPHPHYTTHVLADAGFSVHVQHISLAHSGATAVDPQTIEARIIADADLSAAQAVYVMRTGEMM